jgi:hypothetical protein
LRQLLALGGNVNATKSDGEGVLHVTMKSPQYSDEMVDALIALDCSLDAKDNFGTTPYG